MRRYLLVSGIAVGIVGVVALVSIERWKSVNFLKVRHAPIPLIDAEGAPHADAIQTRMASIGPGSFWMGTPNDDPERDQDETWREVTISKGFQMGETEVSQHRYEAVMGERPMHGRFRGQSLVGEDLPAAGMTWFEAIRFCNALSTLEDLDPAYEISGDRVTWKTEADGYRLPTEAEWEYAARAGSWKRYGTVEEPSEMCGVANVGDRSARRRWEWSVAAPCEDGHAGPAPVGSFAPNAWNLYDVTGNVWEWTWDGFGTIEFGPAMDPITAPAEGQRVVRGGSWYDEPFSLRMAARDGQDPDARRKDLGFRVARSLP